MFSCTSAFDFQAKISQIIRAFSIATAAISYTGLYKEVLYLLKFALTLNMYLYSYSLHTSLGRELEMLSHAKDNNQYFTIRCQKPA